MTGSDRSANLGGMLNQIGDTFGSRGADMGNKLGDMITKSRAPKVDPNDLESYQRAARYARATGDNAGASAMDAQYRLLSAEKKEAEKVAKAEKKSSEANTATFAYKTALESGDADQIAEAEASLLANATLYGYDGMQRMAAASSHVRNQQDQAFQQAERVRQGEERAANEVFMAKMNATESTAEIQAIVDDAAPEMQATAQAAATRRLQYLEGVETRRAREAENAQIIDTNIEIPTDTAVLPEALQKQFAGELEQLEKEVEASKVNGTYEPGVRRRLQRRRDVLEGKVSDAATRSVLSQASEERAELRSFDNKWTNVAIDHPTKAEAEEIKKELEAASEDANEAKSSMPNMFVGSDNITSEMVVEEFRRRQYEALEKVRPGGPREQVSDEPRTFTESEEARIAQAMAQNKGKTREQVIAKLYPTK